jgi:general secretion pathway protein G
VPAPFFKEGFPMTSTAQKGFSLLELLVAMMIIAVLGTLGFQSVRKNTAQARHEKAKDDLRVVSDGLAQYYLKHGRYPDFGSFDAMVEANSALVKENLIKTNMSAKDPFDQPYEGKSSKLTFELKCEGSPNFPDQFGPIVARPDTGVISANEQPNNKPTTPEAGK